MAVNSLTQERLKEVLHYCPDTGIFTWKENYKFFPWKWKQAGTDKTPDGYVQIGIDNKKYNGHRLAFLYMEGRFPKNQVDHINRVENDNRWANLRHATARENQCNRKCNCSFIGVSWNKRSKKWNARGSMVNGKVPNVGTFFTHFAACYARHAYDLGVKR